MAFPSSKCVLLLTDDTLCIYEAGAKGVILAESFGWRTPDFESNVANALNRIAGDGLVYILNDGVEQHYRKEKINKLTLFEKNSIISRRLNIAFPNYPIRAAYPLRDKKVKKQADQPPAQQQEASNLFLFAAAPSTDSFRKLLEAVRRSECVIADYCLLPVESVSLVDKLAAKIAKENLQQKKAEWSILLGQHHGGSMRQIVTRNGQLALTRITPVSLPSSENGAQWAMGVVQELLSTTNYLGRFGYSSEDMLDIILIGRPDFGTLVEDMISIPANFSSITLQRAAELVGVKVGRDHDQNFADPLFIAWHAKKPKHVLPMDSKEIKSVSNPRKAAFFGMLLLTLGLGYLAYGISNEVTALTAARSNLEEVNKTKILADQMYNEELRNKESLGIDIKLIQASLAIYEEMDSQSFDSLPVLEKISNELKELRINSISLKREAASVSQATPENPDAPAVNSNVISMTLGFEFPGTVLPEEGNRQLTELRGRLTGALEGFQVQVSKFLQDTTYLGELSNETGLTAKERKAEEVYTGEILIQKDTTNAPNPGPQ